jgi:hypothetical protein
LEDALLGYSAHTGYPEPVPAQPGAKNMADPHVHYLAHHWLILAGPAFLPAFVVVGVVLYVAMKDRRGADSPDETNTDSKRD